MFDVETIISLLTLTSLEIVLGIDNIIVIAIVAATLPAHQRDKVRIVGLSLALFFRVALLLSIAWIASLVEPLFEVFDRGVSGRDLLMFFGGLFLIIKAVHEMHEAMEEAGTSEYDRKAGSFGAALAQIIVLDIVFSFDSVITAVGMAQEIWVMVTAVIIAVGIMLVASGPIVRFIHVHPSVKMLALAFVLLVGVALVADGMGFKIPKGYLYFAMLFSVFVESMNILLSRRRRRLAQVPHEIPKGYAGDKASAPSVST